MIKNLSFALGFRFVSFLFALAGILKQIGAFNGNFGIRSFMFYTLQSNLLAVILFAYLAIKTLLAIREGNYSNAGYHPRLGMVVAVNLLLTLIVFWAMLVPQGMDRNYLWSFENIAVHTITPLLCLLDYILFSKAGSLKYRDVYYVLIFPFCYLVFSSIAGLLGYVYYYSGILSDPFSSSIDAIPVRFPYFFMDFDRLGIMVLVYIFGLMVFFLTISHGIYFIDRRRQKKLLNK